MKQSRHTFQYLGERLFLRFPSLTFTPDTSSLSSLISSPLVIAAGCTYSLSWGNTGAAGLGIIVSFCHSLFLTLFFSCSFLMLFFILQQDPSWVTGPALAWIIHGPQALLGGVTGSVMQCLILLCLVLPSFSAFTTLHYICFHRRALGQFRGATLWWYRSQTSLLLTGAAPQVANSLQSTPKREELNHFPFHDWMK